MVQLAVNPRYPRQRSRKILEIWDPDHGAEISEIHVRQYSFPAGPVGSERLVRGKQPHNRRAFIGVYP